MSEHLQTSSMGRDTAAGGHKQTGQGASSFIAGVFVQTKNKKMSIYDAMLRGVLMPGTALVLLEVQAASGLLTDPESSETLSVEEALSAGLIGRDFYTKLLSAEGAVTGYTDPCTGHKLSLFQAMEKEVIVKAHAIRLLEAQVATGGIIDPVHGHRIPVDVAHERGYLDRDTSQFLSNPKNQARSCFDPNTHENLTYTQLLRRCVPDADTGLLMLQLVDRSSMTKGRKHREPWREAAPRTREVRTTTAPEIVPTAASTSAEMGNGGLSSATPGNEVELQAAEDPQEHCLKKSLKSAVICVDVGELKGKKVSLLDLLFSKRIPQGQRQELLGLYRAGMLTAEQVAAVVTTIMKRAEAANSELLANARGPHKEAIRAEENGDTLSTEDAELDNVLKATTMDLPVDEFQGGQVSVWDLLHSRYIPEENREQLLELYRSRVLTLEQMVTVVTTVIRKKESTSRKMEVTVKTPSKDTRRAGEDKDGHSPKEESWERSLKTTTVDMDMGEFRGHRVSVWDLLHSRYIPEEKRQELLEQYRDGTLTLEELVVVVSTLIRKKESTSRKMEVTVKTSSKDTRSEAEDKDGHSPKEEQWERALKTTMVDMDVGEFRGHRVSVWDLLHSRYIPKQNREELLELYQAGELTLEQVKSVVSTIVSKTEAARAERSASVRSPGVERTTLIDTEHCHGEQDRSWEETLRSTTVEMAVDEPQGKQISLWDLLHSRYIPEEKRQELLELYRDGTLTLERLMVVVSTLIRKKESTSRKMEVTVKTSSKDTGNAAEDKDGHSPKEESWERSLKTTTVDMDVGAFRGHRVSVWELLHSRYIPEEKRQELLERYRNGALPVQELLSTLRPLVAQGKEEPPGALPEQIADLLQSEGSYVTLRPSEPQRVSVRELLRAQQVREYRRNARLASYGAAGLTVNEITITTTVVTGSRGEQR